MLVSTQHADGVFCFFFFQAEDGIRDYKVTGVQTCALPICAVAGHTGAGGLRAGRPPRAPPATPAPQTTHATLAPLAPATPPAHSARRCHGPATGAARLRPGGGSSAAGPHGTGASWS